jgi:hypothetical protein
MKHFGHNCDVSVLEPDYWEGILEKHFPKEERKEKCL